MSRIMLIPWQLLPPCRRWQKFVLWFWLWQPTSSWRGDPLVTTAAALVSWPSTSGSISVDCVISLYEQMVVRLQWHFKLVLSVWSVIPGTLVAIYPSWGVLCCNGGDGKWMIFCLSWSADGRRVESSSAFRRKLERFCRRWGMSSARATRLG